MLITVKCLLIFIQFNVIKCLNSSSLTFLIDSYIFMLPKVRIDALAIMDTVLNEKSSYIKEIVLFTFNPQDVTLIIKTSSRKEFTRTLWTTLIQADSNECSAVPLESIKRVLDESLPKSFIYVLTKSTAKDYTVVDDIKNLCNTTESQIVFLLMGSCQWFDSTGYDIYYEIAAASSGHVFQVPETGFYTVLQTIEEILKLEQHLLIKKYLQSNKYFEFLFTVHNSAEYILVYVSGAYVRLNITGPTSKMKKITWISNAKVVKISEPAPGKYFISVKGDSTTSIAVYVITDVSELASIIIEDTSSTSTTVLKKPEIIIEEGANLTVKYGSSVSVTCTVSANWEPSIDWKDDTGNITSIGPIVYSAGYKFSKTLRISNLKESKRYYCISQSNQTEVTETVDLTVLSPFKVNSYPEDITYAMHGYPLKLKCNITSDLPMTVIWTHINDRTKLKETIRMSEKYTISWDQTELTINSINFDSLGEYTCTVSLPFDEKEFKAFTTSVKLKNIVTPRILDKNVTTIQVEENSPVLIQCKVAEIGPKISWEFKALNEHAFQSIPQSIDEMNIPRAVMQNSGYYKCIAETVMGRDEKVTELVVTKMPVAIILNGLNINVSYASGVVLTCKVLSYPVPNIIWTDSSGKSIYSEILTTSNKLEYTSVLKVSKVTRPGKYYCLAENVQGKTSANIEVTISSPFNATMYPEPITNAEFGKSLSIKCLICSHLLTKISWYRYNETTKEYGIIGPSDKYSISWDDTRLTINHVDLDTIGKYSCKASLLFDDSIFIKFDTDVRTTVISHPKIDKNFTMIEVQENTPASIECLILEGTPAPQIKWQFKYQGTNEFITIPVTGEMVQIPNAILQNAGSYKCIAENIAGIDIKITELIVKKAPVVTILEGKKMDNLYNKELLLTCKVIAFPKPMIIWYDDHGKNLPAEILPASNKYECTSFMKVSVLKKITRFYCHAVNSMGEATANIDVTLRTILYVDPEVNLSMKYGGSLTIECGIKSELPILITWTHVNDMTKETEIVKDSEKYFLSWDGTKLTITLMNFDLVGKYSCKASSLFDPKQYAIHNTNVKINGLTTSKFNEQYSSVTVREHTLATIDCGLHEGTPKFKISWQFKSRGSQEFLPIPDFKEYSLRISSVHLQNAGYYRCVAENSTSHHNNTTELVVVKKPLVMIVEGSKLTLSYGAELTLTCRVTAYPVPSISWSSNKDRLLPSQNFNTSTEYEHNNRLRISSLKKTINFTCQAENSEGVNNKSVEVIVKSPFQVLEYPKESVVVEYGKEYKIRCTITSPNPMRMQWFRTINETNKIQISHSSDTYNLSADRNELTIKFMDADLAGKYTCKAFLLFDADKFEEFDSYLFLDGLVSDKAHTADAHHIYLLAGNTRNLKCLAPHTEADPIKWYMNGKDTTVTETFLTLSDVDVSLDGNYTCEVISSIGSNSNTYVVDVGYIPVFINVLAKKVIKLNDTGNLDCKANAKPEAKVEWTYNGAPVNVSTSTFELNISSLGQYSCNISNIHGSVTRCFNVTSDGCLINRNVEATPYTPLILDSSSTLPLFEVVDEFLFIKPGSRFKLSCHSTNKTSNYFQKYPEENELEATCYHKDTFIVNEKLYKYSDFHCKKIVLPAVIKTEKQCLGNNTELIRIGFHAIEFIEIYLVCLDTEKIMPLYTRLVMRRKVNKINTKAFRWFRDPQIGFRKIRPEYSCENVQASMCYARAQLVSVHDVPFGPAQTSTFIDHLNTVPLWKFGDGADRMTWEAIEDNIRDIMNVNNEITVWTGCSDYNHTPRGNIPRFLWKILMFKESDTTVIIYVNDPSPTDADIRCENTCGGSSRSWIQTTDVYTYCCNFDDFLTAFKVSDSITSDIQLPNIKYQINPPK